VNRILKIIVGCAVALSSVGYSRVEAIGTSQAIRPMVDYGSFVPNIDLDSFLSQSFGVHSFLFGDCEATSVSGTTEFTVGPPRILFLNERTAIEAVIADEDADVSLDCDFHNYAQYDTYEGSWTIRNQRMAAIFGTALGTMNVACNVGGEMELSTKLRIGGAVPGGADLYVTSGSSPVTFICSYDLIYDGTTSGSLNGTIEGELEVFNPRPNTSLCGTNQFISCVAVRVRNADVHVVNSTGYFAGLSGTGKFSFQNHMRMPEIDEWFAGKGVSSQSLGRSPITTKVRKPGKTASLTLNLAPGGASARILRPFQYPGALIASVYDGDDLIVVSQPGVWCTLSARHGSSAWKTIGSKVTNQSGLASITLSGPRLANFKSTGVSRNGIVSMRAACGPGGLMTDQKQVKYKLT
jgi:hypothetical protein